MRAGGIDIRDFELDDVDDALSLSAGAGWPHTLEDWTFAVRLSEGVVAVNEAGKVVGTALMTPYGSDCATLNMVIVDARLRGHGLGRRLMDAVLSAASDRRLRLIATTDGLPLYRKLGFDEVGAVVQHQGVVGVVKPDAMPEAAKSDDLPAIAALDRKAFGADRSRLVATLAGIGEFAVLRQRGDITAFACIRAFGRGEVIGPVVASELDEAKALVSHFMSLRTERFLRLDTSAVSGLSPWLQSHGLRRVGDGVAMARGQTTPTVSPTVFTFALANQAFG